LRLAALVTTGILTAMLAVPVIARNGPPGSVDVQLLGINDFHGNLEPPAGSSGRIGTVNAGGVEYLATHVKALEATNPENTVVLSAGDLIGASPLISALFHDEPTIEAMNLIGLDVNGVGNHEFDEGVDELIRMQEGGCHPVDGCIDGDDFAGADFRFLAANVTWKSNGKPIFPAYKMFSFAGARIAVVGIVTRTTPSIVLASGIQAVDFHDEADTVNALLPELKKKGIETIVVLIHEGGFPTGAYNECPGISGPIVDIVERTDDEVDLFISGHTHQAYNCIIDGDPVSSGSSFGRIVTDIDMTIDRSSGEPTSISIDNQIVTRDVPKDTGETTLITKYSDLSAPFANRVVGNITADITRTANAAGESSLGNFIADSQHFVSSEPAAGGAVAAFMNPGGIRADLTFAATPPETENGVVRYAEIFTVQPFGNSLVTMTLTGTQIDRMLEEQFGGCGAQVTNRILQVSSTVAYTWDATGGACAKVDIATITIGGVPIVASNSYRVTVNSFLADGGDNFAVLRDGTDRLGGDVDLDAVEKYFIELGAPVAPPALGRITRVN
jgi:5'-nucleotidase